MPHYKQKAERKRAATTDTLAYVEAEFDWRIMAIWEANGLAFFDSAAAGTIGRLAHFEELPPALDDFEAIARRTVDQRDDGEVWQ